MSAWEVRHGDCLEVLAAMDEGSVDAVITDPPYGLRFMGVAWDTIDARKNPNSQKRDPSVVFDQTGGNHNPVDAKDAARTRAVENRKSQDWHHAWATEALRVLKPGGHLLAFGGTRTFHRLTCAIEDAGFEIRDCLSWLYGSGFPKSLNLGGDWQGWGTALKPAWEPITMARKPLVGTVAQNVGANGTGALNVDSCRLDVADRDTYERNHSGDRGHDGTRSIEKRGATDLRPGGGSAAVGRWPANLVLDEEAAAMLDEQTGVLTSGDVAGSERHTDGGNGRTHGAMAGVLGQSFADSGGASRFFYCAKTSRSERNAGLEDFGKKMMRWSSGDQSPGTFQAEGTDKSAQNHHPTVKPIALMRWLCRLVTPPNGLILDPFCGSGTTGCAAALEGFRFIGIEREAEYVSIAEARIAYWKAQPQQLELDAA